MAENQEELIKNLLSRTANLGKRHNGQPKSKDVQKTSNASTKRDTKLKKRTKQAIGCSQVDSSKEVVKKHSVKKDVLFSAIKFSSSDEEPSVELSSICGSCDNPRYMSKDGSISVAYSANLSAAVSDTRAEIDTCLVSSTQESIQPNPAVPEESYFVCPDSQPNSRETSAIIDRLWTEHHPSLSQRNDGSLDSENLSDILRHTALEVIPASQQSFDLRSQDESVSSENDSMSVPYKRPSVLPSSSNVCSSSSALVGSPLEARSSPDIRTALSPTTKESSSSAPRLAQHPHSADQSKPESDLEQSVLMLSDRLNRIMSTEKTKRHPASKTRKKPSVLRIVETSSENMEAIKLGAKKGDKGLKQEKCHLLVDFRDESENCTAVSLTQQFKSKSPVSDMSMSRAKNHRTASVQKHLQCAVAFSSEDEITAGHKQDSGPYSDRNADVDVQPSTKSKKANAKVMSKICHAVSFSSDDDCTNSTKNPLVTSKQDQSSSLTSDVLNEIDTDMSVASSKADDDIALLSARFDSILCTSNKKSTKTRKSRQTKKKVSKKTPMLEMFSSSDEEATERKVEERDVQKPCRIESNTSDSGLRDISLQVSLASTPDTGTIQDQSGCTTGPTDQLQNEVPQMGSSPGTAKLSTTAESDYSPVKQTTDQSLQVSFASHGSIKSTDDGSSSHTEQCSNNQFVQSPAESDNVSPAPVCDLSLQVSLLSHNEFVNISEDIARVSDLSGSDSLHLTAKAHEQSGWLSGVSEISAPDDQMYKTALMEVSGASDDLHYRTVAEFRSFEENATDNSSPLKKESEVMPLDNVSSHRTSQGRRQTTLDSRANSVVISGSDVSDKENCRPMSDSGSDDFVHSKLVSSSDDESSEDCFVVPESMSEDDQARNRQLTPSTKQQGKMSAVHRITFSSDESDSQCSSRRKPVLLKIGKQRKTVRESLSRVSCTQDNVYDTSLPDLDLRVKRRPSVRFQQPSDSSEDELESFLQKVKQPKVTVQSASSESLDDFIVDDDDMSSEDDSVFYLRTNNRRTKKSCCTPEVGSVSVSEEDDEDIVIHDSAFKTPVAPPVKPKSYTCKPVGRVERDSGSVFSTPSRSLVNSAGRPNSTGHSPQRHSFLRSLSTDLQDGRRHADAIKYVKNFKKLKEELTAKLFRLYNNTVFENKIPDDLPVEWNTRLTKTAGYCTYKKIKGATEKRTARIELSVKVCDSAERVRDTLIHELCHAAVWLLYGKTDGHGAYWKHWAQKANLIHRELPVISRCHNYQIQTKYTYKCTKCGYQIGRHSKSLNTDQKVCGYCHSPFELLVNTKSGTRSTPQTPRTPNKFALFVKENYGSVKKQHSQISHKDVMQKLSADFALKSKIIL